jgi:hypothetical protein
MRKASEKRYRLGRDVIEKLLFKNVCEIENRIRKRRLVVDSDRFGIKMTDGIGLRSNESWIQISMNKLKIYDSRFNVISCSALGSCLNFNHLTLCKDVSGCSFLVIFDPATWFLIS